MKTTHSILALLAVGLVAVAGCKKSEQAEAPPQEYSGVKVDWMKLSTTFVNTTPDVQANVSMINRYFRYRQFPQALVELDKLSKNPSLTEPQKKLVGDLIEQTKQVLAKAPLLPGK
jgi:hypothetical protein